MLFFRSSSGDRISEDEFTVFEIIDARGLQKLLASHLHERHWKLGKY